MKENKKEIRTPRQQALFLVKNLPKGWRKKIEDLAEKELTINSDFVKFLEYRKEEDDEKKILYKFHEKIGDNVIRGRAFLEEMTIGMAYFKYAFKTEVPMMDEQEKDWWIKRDIKKAEKHVKSQYGINAKGQLDKIVSEAAKTDSWTVSKSKKGIH